MSDKPGEGDKTIQTQDRTGTKFGHMRPGGDSDDTHDSSDGAEKDSASQRDSHLIEDMRPGNKAQWRSGDPLPEAENAEIDSKKFEEYSMNPTNERNNGKWKAFEQLGYDVQSESRRKDSSQDVVTQLRDTLPGIPSTEGQTSPYGTRFEVRSTILGPNGGEGTLVSVWQIDKSSETPRMITNWLEVHKERE